MLWPFVIAAMLAWLIVVVVIAVILHRRLGASGNPLEWLPFFFVGPLMFGILIGAVAILIPIISLAVAAFALAMFPFNTVMSVTTEGLIFSRRIGGRRRVVKWSELHEIKEIKTFPIPTMIAVLKTGERLELPSYPESLSTMLAGNGIHQSLENDSSKGTTS